MIKLSDLFIVTIFAFCFACNSAPVTDSINTSDAPNHQHDLQFLALGDSYTIGESVAESERWPMLLVDSLATRGITVSKPVIIATTGWRTDELQNAVDSHPEGTYDLVSLLIGVNDQYQGKPIEDYPDNFRSLLETAIERAAGKRENVFVVSIPDYGFTPFGEANRDKIYEELDEYNRLNRSIAEEYGITYFNITDISRAEDPSLVAEDNLHPSGKQYALWVARMMENEKWIGSLRR